VFAVATLSPRAFADDHPTPAQIDAARDAYAQGKALHDKGNYLEAVEKFKESYQLSKNPLLLYNIALTMEEAGGKDLALLYYRKFMTDSPANADQRPLAVERIKALEKELTSHEPDSPTKGGKHAIKPPGTYGPSDFEHQIVEDAPPGQPLDLTASVPEDSGFKVTVFYRNAGEGEFNAVPMRARYKELIGRIPAAKMTGGTVQYYLEVRDTDGTLVTRSGKSVTPNLITIDPNAKPKFYPDFTEEPETTARPGGNGVEEDDPLHPHRHIDTSIVSVVAPVTFDRHDGLTDVGSSKFNAVKWSATASAAALLGVSVLFYVRAHNSAQALAEDSTQCGAPPCRMFDAEYDADVEARGQHDETVFGVTFGIGLAAAAVAAWYWHAQVIAPSDEELKASTKLPKPTTAWRVTPTIDPKSIGASAAVRF
jgi:tetratricopeptide (TPR) repeat protein